MKKVKCIDATPKPSSSVLLVKGRIYEVEDYCSGFVYKIDGETWNKRRFIDVNDTEAFVAPEGVNNDRLIQGKPHHTTHDKKGSVDLEEERCWKMMRPYIAPGHCACGCAKELCFIHRD
jgi:hypothetical protein